MRKSGPEIFCKKVLDRFHGGGIISVCRIIRWMERGGIPRQNNGCRKEERASECHCGETREKAKLRDETESEYFHRRDPVL